jgi:hypothetical protein
MSAITAQPQSGECVKDRTAANNAHIQATLQRLEERGEAQS